MWFPDLCLLNSSVLFFVVLFLLISILNDKFYEDSLVLLRTTW